MSCNFSWTDEKCSPPSTNQSSDYIVVPVRTHYIHYTTGKLVFEVTANHAVSSSDMTTAAH